MNKFFNAALIKDFCQFNGVALVVDTVSARRPGVIVSAVITINPIYLFPGVAHNFPLKKYVWKRNSLLRQKIPRETVHAFN